MLATEVAGEAGIVREQTYVRLHLCIHKALSSDGVRSRPPPSLFGESCVRVRVRCAEPSTAAHSGSCDRQGCDEWDEQQGAAAARVDWAEDLKRFSTADAGAQGETEHEAGVSHTSAQLACAPPAKLPATGH